MAGMVGKVSRVLICNEKYIVRGMARRKPDQIEKLRLRTNCQSTAIAESGQDVTVHALA
jgi:hypothetical protein